MYSTIPTGNCLPTGNNADQEASIRSCFLARLFSVLLKIHQITTWKRPKSSEASSSGQAFSFGKTEVLFDSSYQTCYVACVESLIILLGWQTCLNLLPLLLLLIFCYGGRPGKHHMTRPFQETGLGFPSISLHDEAQEFVTVSTCFFTPEVKFLAEVLSTVVSTIVSIVVPKGYETLAVSIFWFFSILKRGKPQPFSLVDSYPRKA